MKKFILIIFCLLLFKFSFSQSHSDELIGDWTGYLQMGDKKMKLIFHFEKPDKELIGKMDSPEQGAFGLNFSSVNLYLKYLNVELKAFKLSFKGKIITKDSISGEFKQGNFSTPLSLVKSLDPISSKPNRPQEPKEPFPYKVKEVKFKNELENFNLAGTLTIPEGKGPFPAVILISGSGPQNRDEEIMGHKPFLVIADYLTRNGIAVLRYDDRGVGESEGDFQKATTSDFAFDAQSAYIYLKKQKKIDKNKIGIIGHSEGGMIAQIIAANDSNVKLIVLLAAPGVKISELMLKQTEMNLAINGISKEEIDVSLELNKKFYNILLTEPENDKATLKIDKILTDHLNSMTPEEANQIKLQIPLIKKTLLSSWFRYFIKFDPDFYLRQVKCAVLAINGEKDVQVSCEENLYGIANSLEKSGNKRYEFHRMPNLNHLMQNANTGAVSEYMLIEETFSPEVLKIMRDWIKAR